jgi:hypothetical protein
VQIRIEGPIQVRKMNMETFYEPRPWYYATVVLRDSGRVLDAERRRPRLRAEASAGTDTFVSVERN